MQVSFGLHGFANRLSSDAATFFRSSVVLQMCCNAARGAALLISRCFVPPCSCTAVKFYTLHRRALACLVSDTSVLTLLRS